MRDGDIIRVDADAGTLEALVDAGDVARARARRRADLHAHGHGMGRELFALMRNQVGTAEEGGCSLFAAESGGDAAGGVEPGMAAVPSAGRSST